MRRRAAVQAACQSRRNQPYAGDACLTCTSAPLHLTLIVLCPTSRPAEENENMRELGKRLLKQEDLPQFEPVDLTLDMLMAEGGCWWLVAVAGVGRDWAPWTAGVRAGLQHT